MISGVPVTYFLLGCAVTLAVTLPVAILLTKRHVLKLTSIERKSQTAEQMAYLGAIAGGLAHEMKNPLSTLSANLQLLREDFKNASLPMSQDSYKRLDALQRDARRLEETLNDFLRYGRGQELRLQKVQVNDLIREVLDFVGPEMQPRNIEILTSLDETIPLLMLDPKLFKQALLNIILNAEQAMPKGGQIIVRSKRLRRGFQIDITDTGSGIPTDIAAHVFDAFFSNKKGGTGLGLATTKMIVEGHGGTITFESEIGKGTNFRIFIPFERP